MGTIKFTHERWLNIYRYATTGIQLIFIALNIYSIVNPSARFSIGTTELAPYILALSLVHIIYFTLIFNTVARQSIRLATVIIVCLISISLISIIHATGQMHSYWLIGWGLLCVLSGMFGIYIATGTSLLMAAYVIFLIVSGNYSYVVVEEISVAIATFILCTLSWLIWRKTFVDPDNLVIQELTGKLISKEQQSTILIQAITDGIIVTNTKGKISLMNPAAANLTEWSVNEALGLDAHIVAKLREQDKTEIPESESPFTKVLVNKRAVTETYQLLGREGSTRTVSLAISPVIIDKTDELTGAVAVLRDVSAAYAEEARRADFISTASHEMRTPVAAIEGYLALALNEKISNIDLKARSYLEKAQSSTRHLGKLFQDLLTSAKAEDGRLTSHPGVVEMGTFMEQLSEDLKFSAEKKGLHTEFVIGTAGSTTNATNHSNVRPLYYITVDPDRLREVITNIFDNAVKYTDSGKISLGLTGDARVVQIRMTDTGPGIPADDIPHLFQKFYRVDNSSTRTTGGTGLGLFICRKIVELYKGQIWVESQIGQGSTFFVNFPRMDSVEAIKLQGEQIQKASRTLPTIT